MSDWEPGTVAKICGQIAFRDDKHWRYADGSSNLAVDVAAWTTTKPRPLPVIDPEDREQVERMAAAYVVAADRSTAPYGVGKVDMKAVVDAMQAALREFAKPTPPKPDEPLGLGAVVKDRDGRAWVRTHATGYPWHSALDPSDLNSTAARKWEHIDAVEVFTEGWSE